MGVREMEKGFGRTGCCSDRLALECSFGEGVYFEGFNDIYLMFDSTWSIWNMVRVMCDA